MARRSPRCIVETRIGRHEMPFGEWWRLIRAGLIREIGHRLAVPARNVMAWLENGKLQLARICWVYNSWVGIERWAPVRGEKAEMILMAQYATPAFWAWVAAKGSLRSGDFVEAWKE